MNLSFICYLDPETQKDIEILESKLHEQKDLALESPILSDIVRAYFKKSNRSCEKVKDWIPATMFSYHKVLRARLEEQGVLKQLPIGHFAVNSEKLSDFQPQNIEEEEIVEMLSHSLTSPKKEPGVFLSQDQFSDLYDQLKRFRNQFISPKKSDESIDDYLSLLLALKDESLHFVYVDESSLQGEV